MACVASAAAAHGADDVRIPNTSWVLVHASAWDERTRSAMHELAASLPRAYRLPGHAVRFHLDDARDADPDGGHVVASTGFTRRDVTLHARGLREVVARMVGPKWTDEARLARATEYLLRRAVVHELTHVWDGWGRISTSDDWLSISGWSWLSFLPAVSGPTSDFASPHGATSPAEDLASFAEVYFLPPALGPTEADAHPKCRFPAKHRFFRERLPDAGDAAPNVRCTEPADVGLTVERVRAVEILWATPTFSSVAAVGGHLLVMLQVDGADGPRWETYALLAETRRVAPNTAAYVALGLAGGFSSRIVRNPYEPTALRYLEEEGRDVRRFRWKLTEAERARLLGRLDDLTLHWRRPYFFFQRNCSELVIELARAIDPEWPSPPPVTPPDLILASLARAGRIELIPLDAERDLAPITRARLLSSHRTDALRSACGQTFAEADSDAPEWRDAAYARMADHARATNTSDCWRDVANVVALSSALEASHRRRGPTPPVLAAHDALVAAVREKVPFAEREGLHRSASARVAERATAEIPSGAHAQHTPYVPFTLGADVPVLGSARTPMLYVRRDVVRVSRGEHRLFAPARGVDATVLSLRGAIGHRDRLAYHFGHELLRLQYIPQRVLPGLAWGISARLLEGEHFVAERSGDVRWAEAGMALELARDDAQTFTLDASASLAVRRLYGPIRAATLFESPLRAQIAWHPRGSPGFGMISVLSWLPSLSTRGALSHGADLEQSAWLYLGRVSDVGVKLDVTLRGRWDARDPTPELRALAGFRLEPY